MLSVNLQPVGYHGTGILIDAEGQGVHHRRNLNLVKKE